jgi:predicted dehydrogenase
MKRQEFIKSTVIAGMAVMGRPFITFASQQKYKVALVGSGWWGMNILREAIKSGECQVVALCDVDQNQLKVANDEVNKLCNDQPKQYLDYRELFKKEQLDIVINATPDHWHALTSIAAMQAGAHLFLEKPIGHTVNEGKAMLKTLVDTQRTCVVDFHRRYSAHNKSAYEFFQSGKVGEIKDISCFVNFNYGKGGLQEAKPMPNGLDWNAWCGPGELASYHQNIHPRGWRQYMTFANGQIGDWGPHWFDQMLWFTGEVGPKSIYSTKAQSNVRQSEWTSPESQRVIYQFDKFSVSWEHTLINSHSEDKHNVGVYFNGTEGTLHLGWLDGWTFYPSDKKAAIIHQDSKLNEPDQQNIDALFADFLASIKAKKQPSADLLAGHRATNMALLGVVAQKAGKSIDWDINSEKITNDKKLNTLLERKYRGDLKYPKV